MLAGAHAHRPSPSLAASRLDTIRRIASIDLWWSCGMMRSSTPHKTWRLLCPSRRITHRPLATLTPWPRNARTHSKKQIRQIAASIRQFGFTVPVLIDEAGTILAGHGRVAAATLLDLTTVPCLQLTHLSEAQKRAYVLADNKLALNAGWDEDLLATELGALLATDLDVDIGVTGFSIPEVDALLATVAPEESGDPADDALPDTAPARGPPAGARSGNSGHTGSSVAMCATPPCSPP